MDIVLYTIYNSTKSAYLCQIAQLFKYLNVKSVNESLYYDITIIKAFLMI